MNIDLQELLQQKINIYESIIDEIKDIDFALIAQFEKEFIKIKNIDSKINDDPKLSLEKVMKIRL